jgi:hypothetical protein
MSKKTFYNNKMSSVVVDLISKVTGRDVKGLDDDKCKTDINASVIKVKGNSVSLKTILKGPDKAKGAGAAPVKVKDVSKFDFTEDVKQTIVRIIDDFVFKYGTQETGFLGTYPGFYNFMAGLLEDLYIKTAVRDSGGKNELKVNNMYVVGISEDKMYKLVEMDMRTVVASYLSLLECVDKYINAKVTAKYTTDLETRTKVLTEIRDTEITNLNKNLANLHINRRNFTNEDILNLYNNAYWANKGDVSQPLPSQYVPPHQRLHYYNGHKK